MNKPIRVMAVFCLVLFAALLVNVNVVQFVQAEDLNAREGNRRVLDAEFARHRGPILVAGEAVAESVESDGRFEYQRRYIDPELYAPLTGFFSYTYGRSGIERTENSILSGSDDSLFVDRLGDLLGNQQPQGGSVELTIDPAAQKAAAAGLADLGRDAKGAVVALDPSTGAVLAMASQPSYDPNLLASSDLASVQESMEELLADEDEPMLNRGTRQILPPGSTFKLVTAAAGLEQLDMNPRSKVKGGRSLSFPGQTYKLVNEGGSNCGGNVITLEQALNVSCNVSFGWLADKLGQDKLAEQAAKFGFGTELGDEVSAVQSRFTTEGTELEQSQLAQSGIGQFEVAATPLQMATVAAAIANDGEVMEPYVVKTRRAPNLSVLPGSPTEPESLGRAMSQGNAAELRTMMESTVQEGTATSARISGATVGGKTGTAQSTKDRPPYAWFVSYATKGDRQVAVAVVVESSRTNRSEIAGGRLAGPIARSVMDAVIK
ncbi:penicillin-binding transpeptidase domain-containing protein [Aeromicrobium massiliense]|uniref:penicillin-binding transpeptidase domain-containing protein n=1 Tax=Aeromicrobium massiliense TaxID=1464554 RepID=UPI000307D598|nr:penicillin-binding transpeptidase domain-containing protein [Aeromicrobium massiliense]